jgi:hypothetical protein
LNNLLICCSYRLDETQVAREKKVWLINLYNLLLRLSNKIGVGVRLRILSHKPCLTFSLDQVWADWVSLNTWKSRQWSRCFANTWKSYLYDSYSKTTRPSGTDDWQDQDGG